MSIITLDNLSMLYPGRDAAGGGPTGGRRGVAEITFAVPEGALFGFLGPNGAGKTTTIRVLLGLLRPTAGRALVFGLDAWKRAREIKREVGYLPGDLRLYPWLTGREAVRLFGAIRGVDIGPGAKDLASLFNLDLRLKIRAMSRGTRQKLGLTLALAHTPRLLILDEPTSGLDPLMQDALMDRLRSLAATGRTVLFSSHTLSEVERLCDRVVVVRDGRLVADETLERLRAQAGRHVVVRWPAPDAAPVEEPSFFIVERRAPLEWSGHVAGPIEPLVRWLAERRVADLVIGEPDLETLFRRYYEPATPVPPAPPASPAPPVPPVPNGGAP